MSSTEYYNTTLGSYIHLINIFNSVSWLNQKKTQLFPLLLETFTELSFLIIIYYTKNIITFIYYMSYFLPVLE